MDKAKNNSKEKHSMSMSSMKSSVKDEKQSEMSEMILRELNDSALSSEIEVKHSIQNKLSNVATSSTKGNKTPSTRRKLGRKFIVPNLSPVVQMMDVNDTECMMTSFKEGLNASSITINEEKDGILMTLNENSFFQNKVVDCQHKSEEKLRNLVRRSNRDLVMNKFKAEDSLFSTTVNNNLNTKSENDSVIEIRNHSQYSNFELSKLLFEVIHSASETLTVILPPRYISFPYLVIDKAIKIKGSPGTLVEINNGLVVVSSNVNCQFSECSFVFNIEVKSFAEKWKKDDLMKNYVKLIDNKFRVALFYIMQNSSVEINDCDFRAIVHEDEHILEEGDSRRTVWETLFSVQRSELIMQSTICSNFFTVIEAFNPISLKFLHCHFSEILTEAFLIFNTNKFEFRKSTIKNCLSALNIIYEEAMDSSVIISESEFSQNKTHALKILGQDQDRSRNTYKNNENYTNNYSNNYSNYCSNNKKKKDFEGSISDFPCVNLQINNNIFKQNHSSILIKKIKTQFEMRENEIRNNLDTAVEISNLHSFVKNINTSLSSDENFLKSYKETDFNFIMSKNVIKENKNKNSLVIQNLENFKILMKENKIHSNLNGVYILECNKIFLLIKDCHINENFEDGLRINNSNLNMLIDNSKFLKNISNGIALINEEKISCTNLDMISKTLALIKNSEISHNKNGGIKMHNFAVSIEKCYIQENGDWAVELPLEINKQLLKLVNYEAQGLNTMISGPIGGKWGVIENKKSICSNTSCSVL